MTPIQPPITIIKPKKEKLTPEEKKERSSFLDMVRRMKYRGALIEVTNPTNTITPCVKLNPNT